MYDCAAARGKEREEERKREEKRDATRTQRVSRSSERQTGWVKKGTVRTPKGLRERAGRAVGGRGSYKIQFQGCRFNTRHTAQIFHLLSTFRRYVGIRRNGRLCNGCARCKWPGMYMYMANRCAGVPPVLECFVLSCLLVSLLVAGITTPPT